MKIKGKDLKEIPLFQKEREKFYVISLIATGDNPLILSDKESYIIARSAKGLPTWIWTKDHLPPEKYKEIESCLEEFFEKGENDFTSKKEFYDYIHNKEKTTNYLEMGFLDCEEVMNPLKGKGIFVRPSHEDKVTLAEFWRQNVKELYQKTISQTEALEEVEGWLEGKKFYVLKDQKGDIVSMAGYGVVDDLAKITHVFTDPEERGKGYCQYLIYSLGKMLQEEGYKPVLYTDYHYEASNRAYQNVGFQDKGYLINYRIHKS
ncbi:MAG: GNAT family N-acetyltransferase [Bacilli bacterium]|nr:GNAT family N-acetyltransferase [Bacilli bacterium]